MVAAGILVGFGSRLANGVVQGLNIIGKFGRVDVVPHERWLGGGCRGWRDGALLGLGSGEHGGDVAGHGLSPLVA